VDATTDEAGQFRVDHVADGSDQRHVNKAGRTTNVAFARTGVSGVVALTPNQLSATVVLKLGPKSGILLPSVEGTNSLRSCYWLCQNQQSVGLPQNLLWAFLGEQTIRYGERRAVVPPENLVLTISARGYKKWVYHDHPPTANALVCVDCPSGFGSGRIFIVGGTSYNPASCIF
jgi:hypothetical protein